MIIWLYYDEGQIASNYGITKQQYIYYFLFSLTSIPFQISIDILFFNILENYFDYDFLTFFKETKLRFKTRKNLWKRDDEDLDPKIKSQARTKIQIFLSPQFYFINTLHVSGCTLVMAGYIIITASNYNLLSDFYCPCVIIVWVFIMKSIEILCIYAGKKLKIWKVSSGFQKNHSVHFFSNIFFRS